LALSTIEVGLPWQKWWRKSCGWGV